MQKRSNSKAEGIVRYVINDDRFTQPFGYCECRYTGPPSQSTSNHEEISSHRYKRSLRTCSRSKRGLNSNLFVPNLDDQFEIFHSFGSPDKNENYGDLDSDDATHVANNDHHSSDDPIDFEPIYVDQDAIPYYNHHMHLPEMPPIRQPQSKPIPEHKRILVQHHKDDGHPHNLKSSKRLRYSEVDYAVKPTHEIPKPVPKHEIRKPLPDSLPKYHVKSTVPPKDEPHPEKHCNDCDAAKLLSRLQAEYFICCDECRQRILKKFSNEGCKEFIKSSDPTDTKPTPSPKHTKDISSLKSGCDHNKNILENLRKISRKLSELTEGRTESVPKKKETENSNDVKKRLLEQLNNIYEKLKCLNSKDDVKSTTKKRKNCKSRCKCSKQPTNEREW